MPGTIPRVVGTDAAVDLLRALKAEHGEVIFHQSGGCCDGSSPMCFGKGDYIVGDGDIRLGAIDGVPFFMTASQFAYWQHTQLIIDVIPGRGGMFSLENGRELRFLTRSRLFEDEELNLLQPVATADATA